MKLTDFQKYIDLYGADLSRWPAHEIRSAVDLIQRDPEAGKILSAAEKFDSMLRHYHTPAVNTKILTNRIMRETRPVALARTEKAFSFKPATLLVPGSGLIIVAILGFLMGFHMPLGENPHDTVFYTQDQIINDLDEAS